MNAWNDWRTAALAPILAFGLASGLPLGAAGQDSSGLPLPTLEYDFGEDQADTPSITDSLADTLRPIFGGPSGGDAPPDIGSSPDTATPTPPPTPPTTASPPSITQEGGVVRLLDGIEFEFDFDFQPGDVDLVPPGEPGGISLSVDDSLGPGGGDLDSIGLPPPDIADPFAEDPAELGDGDIIVGPSPSTVGDEPRPDLGKPRSPMDDDPAELGDGDIVLGPRPGVEDGHTQPGTPEPEERAGTPASQAHGGGGDEQQDYGWGWLDRAMEDWAERGEPLPPPPEPDPYDEDPIELGDGEAIASLAPDQPGPVSPSTIGDKPAVADNADPPTEEEGSPAALPGGMPMLPDEAPIAGGGPRTLPDPLDWVQPDSNPIAPSQPPAPPPIPPAAREDDTALPGTDGAPSDPTGLPALPGLPGLDGGASGFLPIPPPVPAAILPTPPPDGDGAGQAADDLRQAGIERVESLDSDEWTDHNVDDPGVAPMDILCGFIGLDRHYCNQLPVDETILAPPTDPTPPILSDDAAKP